MKEKLLQLIQTMGLSGKAAEKKLTRDDWAKISAQFKETYNVDFETAMQETENNEKLMSVFASAENILASALGETKTEMKAESKDVDAKAMLSRIEQLAAENATLKKGVEGDDVKKVVAANGKNITFVGSRHTEKHLFGLDHEFFSREKWWNNMSATRNVSDQSRSKPEVNALMAEFESYGASLSGRFAQLAQEGLMNQLPKWDSYMAGTIDYTDLQTKWGTEYVTRRQDALIAYIRSIPTTGNIFPKRYGIQDKEEVTNAFFGEFSQAWQEGEVFKGSFKVQPMLAKVYRAMFKHQFSDLKALEKQHIGYLNREDNQPMKWNFIEWLMANLARVLINEQNRRDVIGHRVEPTTGTAGHSNFAADGVLRLLERFEEELYILPFDDLNVYSSSTMLDYVKSVINKVRAIVPDISQMYIGVNQKHIVWFTDLYRTAYGTQLDFKGSVLNIPDYGISGIVPIPNMDANDYKVFVTLPGNIESYEGAPGEMLKFYFEQRLEALISASWWSEGKGAQVVGKQYDTLENLTASARAEQYIFTNDPFTQLAADATTADGSVNTYFKTQNNTAAKAITTISNAKEGRVYKIVCGGVTNATTIAKSGNFSTIASAWTPTALGDYLKVFYNATDGKFYEVARKVTA